MHYIKSKAEEQEGLSHFVVIIGNPDDYPQTMFTPDRSIRIRDIRDETKCTIMVAEVRYGVPWTMPNADLKFEEMTFRVDGGPGSICSHHGRKALILTADGRVETVEHGLDTETIRNLIQPDDGNAVGEF